MNISSRMQGSKLVINYKGQIVKVDTWQYNDQDMYFTHYTAHVNRRDQLVLQRCTESSQGKNAKQLLRNMFMQAISEKAHDLSYLTRVSQQDGNLALEINNDSGNPMLTMSTKPTKSGFNLVASVTNRGHGVFPLVTSNLVPDNEDVTWENMLESGQGLGSFPEMLLTFVRMNNQSYEWVLGTTEIAPHTHVIAARISDSATLVIQIDKLYCKGCYFRISFMILGNDGEVIKDKCGYLFSSETLYRTTLNDLLDIAAPDIKLDDLDNSNMVEIGSLQDCQSFFMPTYNVDFGKLGFRTQYATCFVWEHKGNEVAWHYRSRNPHADLVHYSLHFTLVVPIPLTEWKPLNKVYGYIREGTLK